MIDAVAHNDLCKVERTYTFEARDIDTILIWIGSALVMRIDPAYFAEIVLGGFRVKLVEGQEVLAFQEMDTVQLHRDGDCPPHSTKGTRTPADGVQPVGELTFELHRAAVT